MLKRLAERLKPSPKAQLWLVGLTALVAGFGASCWFSTSPEPVEPPPPVVQEIIDGEELPEQYLLSNFLEELTMCSESIGHPMTMIEAERMIGADWGQAVAALTVRYMDGVCQAPTRLRAIPGRIAWFMHYLGEETEFDLHEAAGMESES